MSSKKFWRLTWYDFGLWCLRIQELNKQRAEDFDLHKGIAGSLMALYVNAHQPKGGAEYSRSDFYILSTDKKEEPTKRERPDNPEEWAANMQERFKPKGG
jgi:hypothetical protein